MSTAATPRSWFTRWRQRFWRLAPADRGTIVLRHRRIYILPTRRGLAVIATLATMLVASMNYALSLGFALTFLISGLVAAALLSTFRNLLGVGVAPLAAGDGFVGTEVGFTLSFANHGGARQGIAVTTDGERFVTVDLPAGATRPVHLVVMASKRGRQPLGRVTVSSDFPLGLWRAWAYVHFPFSGLVFPSPETPPTPLPGGRQGAGAQRSAHAADAELAGLREYQRGDALNRIAWKAVARGAGWYSKQFEGAGGRGPLEFDWSELPPGLDTEARLSRLTAWVLAAEREARAFALRLPGVELPMGQGGAHRRAALAALALFPAERET